jgi:hypothetical protein
MNRHVCWRDGRSRVYSVEVGQEQNINIGYPAALSAAGELRPVGVDAADIVPGKQERAGKLDPISPDT